MISLTRGACQTKRRKSAYCSHSASSFIEFADPTDLDHFINHLQVISRNLAAKMSQIENIMLGAFQAPSDATASFGEGGSGGSVLNDPQTGTGGVGTRKPANSPTGPVQGGRRELASLSGESHKAINLTPAVARSASQNSEKASMADLIGATGASPAKTDDSFTPIEMLAMSSAPATDEKDNQEGWRVRQGPHCLL